MIRIMRHTSAAMLLVLAAIAPVSAQTETLDEGTFKIQVAGSEVGSETFSIRQNGSGPDALIIAKGRVVLDASKGGTQTVATLQLAGPSLRPAAYEIEMHGADSRSMRATVRGSRVSARIMSAAGENQREYLVSDGAVMLDEGIAHQYYFIARRSGTSSSSMPVVIPRESRQGSTTVSYKGSETVSVAGHNLETRHIVVQNAGGAAVDIWAD